jgi:hypothetical protein
MKKSTDKFTEEELGKIAVDLYKGLIFSSQDKRLVDKPEAIATVFLPLIFFKPEDRDKFFAQKPTMIFEYLDKAGPRIINGLPGFFSFQWLDEEEATRVLKIYTKLKEAEKKVLETTGGQNGKS